MTSRTETPPAPPRYAPPQEPAASRRAGQGWRGVVAAAAFVALLTGGWQVMATALDSVLVPSVPEIGARVAELALSPGFYSALGITLLRVSLGFALAFVLGAAVGIAMGRSPLARRFFEPGVLVGLTVPGLVWALLCVIWFGVDLLNPVLAIALSAAPALSLSVYQGTRAIDAHLLEMAHVYRFPAGHRLRYLWLPSLAPALFAGARLGLSLAWKVIVLVEIFGMSSGVGYEINNEFAAQNVAGVLAWTAMFALVMAILEYGVLQGLERRASRWRKESHI